MDLTHEEYLSHYGILRKSGRYPWGSGDTPNQRNRMFLDEYKTLKKQGLTDAQIAEGFDLKTKQLLAAKSIASNQLRSANISQAQRLRDSGTSVSAIGREMGVNESTVRGWLAPGAKDKADVLQTTAAFLKEQVDSKGLVDVGSGVERHLGISDARLGSALAVLQEQGYEVHGDIKVDQVGTNNQTTLKVLAPPGTPQEEAWARRLEVQQIDSVQPYESGNSNTGFTTIKEPVAFDSDRLKVRYGDEGGADADGVIYVRPGVEDVSLGGSKYAQIRVNVDGTHFIKGMAMYKDDLPDGVDLVFNTPKGDTGNKLDALKPMKIDPATGEIDKMNPFGSSISRQIFKNDGDDTPSSVMNIVNEEGDWGTWSKNLATQVLSKQSPELIRSQTDEAYESNLREFEEIKALTNPTVRKALLQAYSDDVDASAVHLKAAAMPRQSTHVILPVNEMRDNEIFAPNFRDGEKVILARFPHGGTFEMPELIVNNRHPAAKDLLAGAKDAVGVTAKVAERLSGADFDGDTVLVIPDPHGKFKTTPALKGLENFEPKRAYPAYDGMPAMDSREKGLEMGRVTNLITDMQLKGANANEVAAAMRHSMVVIDAEKHNLNWRQSEADNGIPNLMKKYQGRTTGGASTLISRATSEKEVDDRKLRPAKEGGPIDLETGALVYVPTNKTRRVMNKETYTDPVTGKTATRYVDTGKTAKVKTKVAKLALTDDARTLVSETNTEVENLYAAHSNRLKALANEARLEMVHTKDIPYSPSAKAVYSKEVGELNAALNIAIKNRPLERQAQIIANSIYRQKKQANPDMDREQQKKIKNMAIVEARARMKASKQLVKPTEKQWEAIQAGAISKSKLEDIIKNADQEVIKQLAMPRAKVAMPASKVARAKAMVARGVPYSDVADALGVSPSTIKEHI